FPICYRNNPDLNNGFLECIDDNNYAIIVACENYEKAKDIRNVEGVIENAEHLKQVLTEKYLFTDDNIFFYKNISRDDFENKMNELQYTITNDKVNIMFYFIGHGTMQGEFICSDGKPLTKITLYDYIKKLANINNILTIIDACYSGSFKKNQETYNNPNILLLNTYDKKSRILITSANNKSTTGGVFTKYFVKKLEDNEKRYISIDEIFNSLMGNQEFISENKSDAPTSTIFDKTNHTNGTFFFINKNNFKK
ncbi:MAG: C13 family peptidase, partial [Bacteroidota bacterium]|nr:C13 family peptidase [Bacteroidota bacterium]